MKRRQERLSEFIREELSELLRRQVKDPRLGGFLTITRVEISPDLRMAKVYVSILGSETEQKEALAGFSSASGYLRRELAQRLSLRHAPQLTFHEDTSLEKGAQVLKLIDEVSQKPTPPA